MKILSKEEFTTELNRIVTCGTNDIEIGPEDMKIAKSGDFFAVEYLDSKTSSIILDIEDVNQIRKNKDLLVMSATECSGNNSAQEAIKSAVLDFEKNNLLLKEADGILVYFQTNSNYEIMKIGKAMEIIYDRCESKIMDQEPDVIWGMSCDDSLSYDYVKVTIFIGYAKKTKYVNNYIVKS